MELYFKQYLQKLNIKPKKLSLSLVEAIQKKHLQIFFRNFSQTHL